MASSSSPGPAQRPYFFGGGGGGGGGGGAGDRPGSVDGRRLFAISTSRRVGCGGGGGAGGRDITPLPDLWKVAAGAAAAAGADPAHSRAATERLFA